MKILISPRHRPELVGLVPGEYPGSWWRGDTDLPAPGVATWRPGPQSEIIYNESEAGTTPGRAEDVSVMADY